MVCPKCGQQNRQSAGFCDTCGAPLVRSTSAVASVSPRPLPDTEDTGPGGGGWRSPVDEPPTPPSPTPPSPTPPLPARQGQAIFVGVARNVQQAVEQHSHVTSGGRGSGFTYESVQVLRFRLEQFDAATGNRVRVLEVELRARSIEGFLTDGDQVEVRGEIKNGLIRAKEVRSLTTGAVLQAPGLSRLMKVVIGIFSVVALAVVIGAIGLFVFIVLVATGVYSPGPPPHPSPTFPALPTFPVHATPPPP